MSYESVKQKILDSLVNRPEGTQVLPEKHQEYELDFLEYVKSIESISNSSLMGYAEPDTIPVQPNDANVFYISLVGRGTTNNYINFRNSLGESISLTASDVELKIVTLNWNKNYWSSQSVTVDFSDVDDAVDNANAAAGNANDAAAAVNSAVAAANLALQTAIELESNVSELEQEISTSEQVRTTNEQNRVANEQGRTTAETSRANAESSRDTSESTRVTQENSRVAAEAARVAAGAALKTEADIYNVTVKAPLAAGQYYTATTARAAVPSNIRKLGLIINYATAAGVWAEEKYIGADVANWAVEGNWTKSISNELGVNINSSVSQKKITEELFIGNLIEPTNKANPSLFKSGGYINNANGSFVTFNTSYFCVGFLPVTAGVPYILWNNNSSDPMYNVLHFYGAGGNGQNWLGSNSTIPSVYSGGAWYFTPPTGCEYIACNADLYSLTQTFEQFKATVMLEKGTIKSQYSSYFDPYIEYSFDEDRLIDKTIKRVSSIENIIENRNISVIVLGTYVYIRSSFNESKDIVKKLSFFSNNPFENNCVMFNGVWIVDKSRANTASELESGEFIHWANDDISPSQINDTYIGATHGSYDVLNIVSTSHGKTVQDVGSEWIDSSLNKFYILRIVDANNVWVLSKNQSLNDKWSFIHTINGNLSHSANATNTSTINISSYALTQMLPAVNNQIKKLYIDGVEINQDGVYQGKDVLAVNSYDIVNPASALLNVIAAVGSLTQPPLNNGQSVLNINNSYKFDSNGGVFMQNAWRNTQDVKLNYVGFTQQYPLDNSIYPRTYVHIPKSLPITAGGRTFDFRELERFEAVFAPTAAINLTNSYWSDSSSPCDRWVQFLADNSGVNKVGFASGYDIVTGVCVNRENYINNAMFIHTTRKIYPFAIDSKLNVANTLSANKWYESNVYRKYFDCGLIGSKLYSFKYDVGEETRVYIGYKSGAIINFDNMNLNKSDIGRKINVIESSANIIVHNNIVNNQGIVLSKNDTNYGYLVLNIT